MIWATVAHGMEPVVEELDGGHVDWTRLQLVASATGEPASGAVATPEVMEGDARSKLGPRMLELARRVRVDASRTTADVLDARDAVADRVADNLALWEVYEVRYFTSGRVEMEGALPLQAWLRPALADWAAGEERPTTGDAAVTGLVVDARGLAVKPALAPRIEDAAGEALYTIQTLTELAASQRGPVVYVRDPADVHAARRAGEAPLVVRAAGVADGTDLVLGEEAARKVRDAAAQAPFLLHGNVVVVVDR
ncbi:MAG: hypothetical protein ACOZNI_36005 [Myxococcota bacterium]